MAIKRYPSLAHWGAFTAVVEDGRFIGCEPFPTDPYPSPMLESIAPMVYSPTRIRAPSVRRSWLRDRRREGRGSDSFIEVGWDEALALVHEELERVRTAYGSDAIFGGSYGWASAGRLHHARTLVRRFLFAGGGCVDQAGNYSWGAAQFLLPHVIGTYAPVAGKVTHRTSIRDHTRLFVAFGGLALKNAQVSAGGTADHNLLEWLRATKAAGCRFVVVSPSEHDAPAILDADWIAIRPNTDTALMLALAYELIANDAHDRQFLARYCTGFERLSAYITGSTDGTPKTPHWASKICGVPAERIARLARELPRQRTLLTAAWSLQRAHHGEQPYWMLIALAAMLGEIGLPGGGFGFGHGSIHGVGNPRPEVPAPEMAQGKNPLGISIPVARIADMLLHPGEPFDFNGTRATYPHIRLVYWAGGNPFHHHQNLNRLRRAWARPETIVVHDTWWTATARHADIVLPATTSLERNDVGGSSRDRFIIAMQQAIEPVGEARNDFDIFAELAARSGFAGAFTERRDERAWLEHIHEVARAANEAAGIALPPFATFWERGFVEQPLPAEPFVLFAAFRADPEQHRLATPSGRIELYSETIAKFDYPDCPPHPQWLPPREWLGAPLAATYPLHLVTVQPPDRLHAQLDPGPVAQRNKVAGREKLRIHPRDADERGLRSGDVVQVWNGRGACLAGVEVDRFVAPGVVMMATGAWYDPLDARDGALDRHGNANVLSFDAGTSRLTQGPSALSVLVEVRKWEGKVPPVERTSRR